MNIRGFLLSSFNEWEKRVSAVIFVGGCNWRCPYCHGAALVDRSTSFPEILPVQIFAALASRRAWIDGVVVTGGEPSVQPDLLEFIRELRAQNFAVKLSTNGSHPEIIRQLLAESDLLTCLSFDYKTTLNDRLNALTERKTAAAVQESFALAREAAVQKKITEIEFHTTLCPAFINEDILRTMAQELNCPEALWILQQYENDVEMLNAKRAGLQRYSQEEIESLATECKKFHPHVLLRTGK